MYDPLIDWLHVVLALTCFLLAGWGTLERSRRRFERERTKYFIERSLQFERKYLEKFLENHDNM